MARRNIVVTFTVNREEEDKLHELVMEHRGSRPAILRKLIMDASLKAPAASAAPVSENLGSADDDAHDLDCMCDECAPLPGLVPAGEDDIDIDTELDDDEEDEI